MLAEIRARQLQPREGIVLAAREQVLAENSVDLAENTNLQPELKVNSTMPREVLKDGSIEKENNISRSTSEERNVILATPADWKNSQTPTANTSSGESHSEAESLRPTATTSTRDITGIAAQHSNTSEGIKVMIALQTADDAELGAIVELTAELKRSDRIRELKPYAGDSEQFANMYATAKQDIRDLPVDIRENTCIGRVHARGKRSAWFANMVVVGVLDNNILTRIIFWSDCDDYHIDMDLDLSKDQVGKFHSSGRYGNIVKIGSMPTLHNAKRVPYRG